MARPRMLWVMVRGSLWFLPGALTLLAAGLAILMVRLENLGVGGAG